MTAAARNCGTTSPKDGVRRFFFKRGCATRRNNVKGDANPLIGRFRWDGRMGYVGWEQYQSTWNGTYVSGSPGRIDARSIVFQTSEH